MASQVLGLCGEVDTAYHPGGSQGGHLVIVDGQHTQVVLCTSRQVVNQDVLTGWGYHSVKGENFVSSDVDWKEEEIEANQIIQLIVVQG